VLVREGRVEELLGIENQTELILQNASAEVLAQISALLDRSGTRLVEQRRPQTTLEHLFLEATKSAHEE
jgi:ABC-2 type transport system ATP-binding protein